MRYSHTNIITKDWNRLAEFYCKVFGCLPVPPEREQSGDWLDRGTGLHGAKLQGVHLLLPGHGDRGPTLEIYQYEKSETNQPPVPNRLGLGHLAFEVDSVPLAKAEVLKNGGSSIGEIAETFVNGVGKLTFLYMADPDGNILELQHWARSNRNTM